MHKNEMTAEEKIYVKEYARPGENENQAYERLLGFRDFEWEARDSEIQTLCFGAC